MGFAGILPIGTARQPHVQTDDCIVYSLENLVLEYTISKPEGILVLKPKESLNKADFAGLSTSVDD